MVDMPMSVTDRLAVAFRDRRWIDRTGLSGTDLIAVMVVGLWPLFFMTVRSWTNGSLFILGALALLTLVRRPMAFAYLLPDPRVGWMLAAFLSAILAILFSQVLRGELVLDRYDAPARILLGGLVFLYVADRRIDFVRMFQWVCPLSVFVLALELALSPLTTSLWIDGRWSTYFVDPLSLGQYAMLLGFFCLFSINLVEKDEIVAKAVKIAGFLVGIVISIGTGSRSGWVAVPVLFVIWLVVVLRIRRLGMLLLGLIAFAALCVVLYLSVDLIQARIDAAWRDYADYFSGRTRDSSAGLRLSMIRASWHLFLTQPLYGFGDGHLPALGSVPAIASYYSELLDFTMTHQGVHNELLQNLLRSGVFGLASFLLMYVVPVALFARAAFSARSRVRAAGVIGLTYLAAMLCFGLNTEVSNLKYLASFYGLMMACCAAQVVWATRAASATSTA